MLSDIKHELIDGEVYVMSEAGSHHNRIVSNLSRDIGNQLKSATCEPFIADMKVQVKENYYYPDIIIDCNHEENDFGVTDTPVIIFEVLLRSTRKNDQVLKRQEYQQLNSLQYCVVIEQDVVDVEVCSRSNGWQSEHYFLDDEIHFEVGLTLDVVEICHRVKLEEVVKYHEEIALDIDST